MPNHYACDRNHHPCHHDGCGACRDQHNYAGHHSWWSPCDQHRGPYPDSSDYYPYRQRRTNFPVANVPESEVAQGGKWKNAEEDGDQGTGAPNKTVQDDAKMDRIAQLLEGVVTKVDALEQKLAEQEEKKTAGK